MKGNSLQNETLGMLWNFLHDMDEVTRKTKFAFDHSECTKMLLETDRLCSDSQLPLKIVVGGRMKAGKSMMADLLYFDGRGVLNSDTTPATANIMYIRRAEENHRPGAEITFLTQEEVEEMKTYISNQNDAGGGVNGSLTDQIRYQAIQERLDKIEKVMEAHPEYKKLPGKKKTVSLEEVREYSDGGGCYSDLVNQIDLYIEEPGLDGITIVDTPGVGDPVVSRGQKARDESRTADVVFYLSAASHFMDMEDAEEYVRLKKSGCKNIILIMSRFDEVLEPDSEDEDMDCFTDSMTYCRLAEAGTQRLKKASETAGIAYEEPVIIPICALGAKLSRMELEADDAFYRDSLKEVFPEWDGEEALYGDFGIDEIREEIENIRKRKEKIREQAKADSIANCAKHVFHIYETIRGRLQDIIEFDEKRLAAPVAYEMDKLGVLERAMTERLKKALNKVKSEDIITECKKIEKEISKYGMAAMNAIQNATGPDSINGAYENAFMNAMSDMFTGDDSGIRSRMLFQNRSGHYGVLIRDFQEIFRKNIQLNGFDKQLIDSYIITPIIEAFETEIFSKFEPEINISMPAVNTREILNNTYENLREESSRYKENAIRKKRSDEAKQKCKSMVDHAATQIIGIVTNFENKMEDMFGKTDGDGILSGLVNKLYALFGDLRKKLEDDDQHVIKEDIAGNRAIADKLEELLNEELQEEYQSWKKE